MRWRGKNENSIIKQEKMIAEFNNFCSKIRRSEQISTEF